MKQNKKSIGRPKGSLNKKSNINSKFKIIN